MKAEQLMIGDWIKVVPNHNEKNSYLTVVKDGTCIDILFDFQGHIDSIPITPEILEKNGFTYDKVFNCYSNEYANIRFVEKNGRLTATIITDTASVMISIRYVHELQHALRLCNIDKAIEL